MPSHWAKSGGASWAVDYQSGGPYRSCSDPYKIAEETSILVNDNGVAVNGTVFFGNLQEARSYIQDYEAETLQNKKTQISWVEMQKLNFDVFTFLIECGWVSKEVTVIAHSEEEARAILETDFGDYRSLPEFKGIHFRSSCPWVLGETGVVCWHDVKVPGYD